MAALAAYEVQSSDIAQSKLDGLAWHYGAPGTALEFWSVHATIEEDHAGWTPAGLAALSPSADDVARSVTSEAGAWWEFWNERESFALV